MSKERTNTELLYGIHPVCEALLAGRRTFREVYVVSGKSSKRIDQISELAARRNIPVKSVNALQLDAIVRNNFHQGVGAMVCPYPLAEITDLLDRSTFHHANSFLLLLDSIMDPQNLGALIRTALCAGVDAVVIPKDRAASPSPAVSKASAGALEHVSIAKVTNLVSTIHLLKERGMWILGMDKSAGKSIYMADLTGPIGVIVGGEEKGIRPLIKQNCDEMISIPQMGPVGSLNASAAGAILMYETFRQRKGVSHG